MCARKVGQESCLPLMSTRRARRNSGTLVETQGGGRVERGGGGFGNQEWLVSVALVIGHHLAGDIQKETSTAYGV